LKNPDLCLKHLLASLTEQPLLYIFCVTSLTLLRAHQIIPHPNFDKL
jgi:hypothetical protein